MNAILCLDAGSSSLKFAAYHFGDDGVESRAAAAGEAPASDDAADALDRVLARVAGPGAPFAAVGHRVVFGGPRYVAPVLAAAGVLDELERLVPVEPLHLRAELDLVYAASQRLPGVPQVLCFDTAFHRRSPPIARRLPLPGGLDPLLQRYGFHGLSYEYVASQLGRAQGRTVVAHLGSGASLCAMRDGAPVDTTMGFSALGGLMMATRPGDLDPGIVLRLLANDAYDVERLTDLFYRRSGLAGVSGGCADMKRLLERAAADPAAREAVELFTYVLTKHIGAMIAVLGGLDRLVFTAGIGENAPEIRAAACAPFAYLGLRLDPAANDRSDRTISASGSAVEVLVVPTNENLEIARHTLAVLKKVP